MPRPSQCPVCYCFEACVYPGAEGCAEDAENNKLSDKDQLNLIQALVDETIERGTLIDPYAIQEILK